MTYSPAIEDSAATARLTPSREVLRAFILVVVGLLLPAALHAASPAGFPAGPVFLPLLLPVMLGAFLLPLRSALGVALGLPLLSWATSGMPPMVPPIAIQLILEGAAAVLVAKALLHRSALSWQAVFIISTMASRGVALAGSMTIALASDRPVGPAAVMVAQGFVGVLAVFALLPVLFRLYGQPRRAP